MKSVIKSSSSRRTRQELNSLTAERIDELKNAFKMMDVNSDGVVTRDELKYLFRSIGMNIPKEQLDQFISITDENGDGRIQFEEFCMSILRSGERSGVE